MKLNQQIMPARNLERTNKQGVYSHVYNRGIAKGNIFNDKQDYETFIGFLKDYLTPPNNSDDVKKTFTVKGRTYQGVPHQPKNYFNQVVLVAYSLKPNHFHLLLYQVEEGAIERFMRSLSTRYSMYFNKKYKRTGSLLEGPYKSLEIKDSTSLIYLTRYFHYTEDISDTNDITDYSSYKEFLETRHTPWVNPKIILHLFERMGKEPFKDLKNYKEFIEEYKLKENEEDLLEKIILEKISEHLEGIEPVLEKRDLEEEVVETPQPKSPSRLPQFAASISIFLVLLSLGYRNIEASPSHTIPSPFYNNTQITDDKINGDVAGIEDEKPQDIEESTVSEVSIQEPSITNDNTSIENQEPELDKDSVSTPSSQLLENTNNETFVQEENLILSIVIDIEESIEKINIQQDPDVNSVVVGEAVNGEIFELISETPEWYKIKLDSGLSGYITKVSAKLFEGENINE